MNNLPPPSPSAPAPFSGLPVFAVKYMFAKGLSTGVFFTIPLYGDYQRIRLRRM